MAQDKFSVSYDTNIKIYDNVTGKLVSEGKNAVHPRNMATALARGLSNAANGQVFKIKLGNQGTYVDATQQIVFRAPNVSALDADLYNPTYAEIVDDSSSSVGVGNSVTYTNIPNTTNTRVVITAVVDATEAINASTDTIPAGGTTNPQSTFFFDELGLFTQGTGVNLLNQTDEMLLTHYVFSPIEHTGNREFTIVYSLTISVS